MNKNCTHSNPLNRQGTSQAGRFLQALNPEEVEIHGLNEKDWLQFAYDFSQLIHYYPEDQPNSPVGDWQDFFTSPDEIEGLLNRYRDGDINPHMALFVSFLKLLNFPQQSLNQLPKRHLDYYYKKVLRLKKKPFKPDRVHLLFELAKNAQQELVEENIPLKAGKDSRGNPLTYETTNSVVLNKAKVAALKAFFIDDNDMLRYAPVVNSADGQGADFENDPSWPAFGEAEDSVWPKAELSFYIASPLLKLKEGTRTITLDFDIGNTSEWEKISSSHLTAQFTGEKGWLDSTRIEFEENDTSTWRISLDAQQDAVVGYNESVHEAKLTTSHPVMKISFTQPKDYASLKKLAFRSLSLKVEVEGAKSLQLQNELGGLDPSRPFRPFGSRPKVGSKLKVKFSEMVGKPVTDFSFGMQWLNRPDNFNEYYANYNLGEINRRDFKAEIIKPNGKSNGEIRLFKIKEVYQLSHEAIERYADVVAKYGAPELADIAQKKDHRNFINALSQHNIPLKYQNFVLSTPNLKINEGVIGKYSKEPHNRSFGERPIKLVLKHSFYHDLYPELYVNAVLMSQKDPQNTTNREGTTTKTELQSIDLPNKPYTPLLDELTLDYTAKEKVSFAQEPNAKQASRMFYRHPFGTSHATKKAMDDDIRLLPDYSYRYLYIGLKDAEPGSNISLLFQVAEGTENPLHSSFAEGGGPEWYVLVNNEWKPLDDEAFARNETNNFLQSGIVKIGIPKEATNDDTLLEKGLHWLRIRLKKEPDAVPRFWGVYAQAGEAIFKNEDNTTDHLQTGLPSGSISKLVNPRAQIKTVTQPYDSFGGRPAETDAAYYGRVSERLRHKNRAVTIWDYEHLILQQFPSLNKVKCLNHSFWDSSVEKFEELSPGNITLVLVSKRGEDIGKITSKPKVSQNFKDEVENFVKQYTSLHLNVTAANPIYEPVKFTFGVRFNAGLDANYYSKQVIRDLSHLLAPWIFEKRADVRFGGSFSEYQLVNYLDNLDYVDFITGFQMSHKPNNGEYTTVTSVEPSTPMVVLVPAAAKKHSISKAQNCT